MLANLIFLYGSHYFLNQPGGWINRNSNSNSKNQITNNHNNNLIFTKKLSIIAIFQKNTPQNEAMIALLGLFVIASNMISANAISNEIFDKHKLLFDIIYSCTICFTTALISFPLWPRYKNLIPYIWHIGAFFVLICSSFLVVLISNFSEVQLMVFMTNIIVVSTIMNWRVALSFFTVGIVSTLLMYKSMIDQLQLGNTSLEFKVAYLILLIMSVSIISLKPKQEYLEATEAKADELEGEVGDLKEEVDNLGHVVDDLNNKVCELNEVANFYSVRVEDQAKEIERLGATAQKILNNVNHELRLPVGNVVNFAEMLSEGLEKYSKEHQKMLLDEVLQNSNRLSSMILNMLDKENILILR